MLIAAFGKTPSIDEKPSITANDFFVPCFPGSPLSSTMQLTTMSIMHNAQ